MDPEVFLDTSYVIALASTRDDFHETAVGIARQIAKNGVKIVTTRPVLLEVGNTLSRRQHRATAILLLDALEADSNVGIVPLTEPLYRQAFTFFRDRSDKDWGLVDCISFVVMRERGLSAALTADQHFRQAGFRALLRDA